VDPIAAARSLTEPSPSADAIPPPERAVFTGSGGEYFRIWALNLLLSIATLGVYSAWAKVRREQYFHANTRIAGASFGYHANPMAILRGRAIALGALIALQVSGALSLALNWALVVAFLLVTPWVIVRALRFRLHNTSHRGIRFRFHGTTAQAARVYLGIGAAALASLGLLFPFAMQRQLRFRVENAAFGTSRFAYTTSAGAFYRALFAVALLFVAILGIGASAAVASVAQSGWKPDGGAPPASMIVGIFAAYAAAILVAAPLAQVRLQNLLWNGVTLGPHRFASDQRFGSFFVLQLVNTLATIATLGLFRPVAVVRVARYRAEHLTFFPGASLDSFVADASAGATATGEELAELFDFDIGI